MDRALLFLFPPIDDTKTQLFHSLKLLLLRQRALWRFRPDNLLMLLTAVSVSVFTCLPIWRPLHWSIIKDTKLSSNNMCGKGSDGGFLRLQPPQRLTNTHNLGLPLVFPFHLSLLPLVELKWLHSSGCSCLSTAASSSFAFWQQHLSSPLSALQ